MALGVTRKGDALVIGVRVTPSAVRTVVQGLYGERIKVSVSAPAEAGRANQALVEALADWLGLEASLVSIAAGRGSRDKTVALRGISEEELTDRVETLLHRRSAKEGK